MNWNGVIKLATAIGMAMVAVFMNVIFGAMVIEMGGDINAVYYMSLAYYAAIFLFWLGVRR